ncbi:MAG: saccharopine dehydrogenase NADP-binding domain-containing protein [Candidatus Binatia bacterium]|nr:saccharopine dehydrogenase NADP-binding domain-containing protein [Candidatus Binatia bacterium]
MSDDRYDFTLFGATGFTGREALRYLVEKPPAALGRWAIAGRDRRKLEALLRDVAPGREDIAIVVADSTDPESVDALVAGTRALIHLAGPYARYGELYIRACVDHGTHYVDLTGEIPWVRRMVDAYHERAAERRVKLVFTAGYEALPFDLVTLLAAQTMRERHQVGCRRVDIVAHATVPSGTGAGDMLSGGTVNTLREALREGPEEGADDPAALIAGDAEATAVRDRSPIVVAPWHDDELGGYIGPVFPAPFINPPIVLRSAALFAEAGAPYGDEFAYREGTLVGPSAGHRVAAEMLCLAIRGMSGVLAGGNWLRQGVLGVLDRVGPKSGEGPSEKALAETDYGLRARGLGPAGEEVFVSLRAKGHPGYRSTARMIAEAGLALAFDQEQLPEIYGAVTPATGVGVAVLGRLRDAGVEFEVE